MRPALVSLTLLLLLAPASATRAAPDEHFQGLGVPDWSDCIDTDFLITVDRVGEKWLATVHWPPCSYLVFTVTGIVFTLEGSWANGWVGRAATGIHLGAYLFIGPYGDGTAIEAMACMLCVTDDIYFYGRMRDLALA